MNKVKRKVLLDLFASPATLLPVAAGVSAFLCSWAVDGSTAMNMLGLAGVLGGLGGLATRLIFGLEQMTHKAYQYLHEAEQQQRQQALDQLDQRLESDPDPRTEESLRRLRRLYDGFQEDVRSGRINGQTYQLMDRVEQIFRATVEQLEVTYNLWTASRRLTGKAQKQMLAEREDAVREVMATIDHLARTIEQFHTFHVKRNRTELERLRSELDETLRVARRTEERLTHMDGTHSESAIPYNPSDFEAKE